MPKAVFLAVSLATLLFFSCKEISPAVDFGPVAADTSFMAPVETQNQRTVVIEEFTGVHCPNCPLGHKIIKAIEDQYPGRVATIGIQPYNFKQANPIEKTKHDNRTQPGTDLINGIYGSLSTMPSGGVDRITMDNSLYIDKDKWPQLVADRISVLTPANIKLTCVYNANKKVVITVHVAYTAKVDKQQRLNLAIVEDKIIDAQDNGLIVEENYEHQHVLRDILTAPTGTAILSDKPTKEPGQVYERTFIYDLAKADPSNLWNPDNCKIVAYVSNDEGADKEIIQAAEADLK